MQAARIHSQTYVYKTNKFIKTSMHTKHPTKVKIAIKYLDNNSEMKAKWQPQ